MRRPVLLCCLAALSLSAFPVPHAPPDCATLRAADWSARTCDDGSVTFSQHGRPELSLRSALPAPTSLESSRQRVALHRPGVTEELLARGHGFEQRWRFTQRPDTSELLVPVRFDTAATPEVRPTGLRLTGATANLTYGRATWVDALGRRTAVAQHLEGDTLTLRVDAATLDATAWPAVLDPAISPELTFGPVGQQAAPEWQGSHAMGFDGANLLVVWQDHRTGDDDDVYFARISLNGELRDPTSRPLALGPGDQSSPALAMGAGTAFVVWEDDAPGQADLKAARISPAGVVLDATPLVISNNTRDEHSPAVTFDGTNFVVFWLQNTSATSTDVLALRVAPDGTPVDASPVVLVAGPAAKADLVAAASGTSQLLAWVDSRAASSSDLYVARASTAAAPSTPDGTGVALDTSSNDVEHPSLAINTGIALVAWTELLANDGNVLGARVNLGTAQVLDAPPLQIDVEPSYQWGASVLADGTGWLVGVFDEDDIARDLLAVSSAGVASGPVASHQLDWGSGRQLLFADTTRIYASLAFSGHLVLYAHTRGTGDADFVKDVAVASESQWWTTAVGTGQGYLLTLLAEGDSVWDSYDARLEVWPLDPAGTPTAQPTVVDVGNNVHPRLTSNGSNALILYPTYWGPTELRAQRLTLQGALLDASSFRLSVAGESINSAGVGANGSDYLAVWTHYGSGGTRELLGGRVTTAGVMLDPGGRVLVSDSTDTWQFREPDVASDGTNWVVVWQDEPGSGPALARLVQVTSAGAVLQPEGVVLGDPGAWQRDQVVATGDRMALAVWVDERFGTDDVFGARITADGGVLDRDGGFAISTAPGDQYWPHVTWDGSRFVVVWEDERLANDTHVRGATVTPQGVVEPEFTVTATAGSWRPRVASTGLGRSLVSYHRFTVSGPLNSHRAYLKTVGIPLGQGASCSADGDCASNFCTDGVCCDSACGAGAVDCQVCSAALGASADGRCTPLPQATVCRGAVTVCDRAETCTASGECPPDDFVLDGTTCGTGVCFAGACFQPSTDGGVSADGGVPLVAPVFTSTPGGAATCNGPWLYAPTLAEPGPVTFRVRPVGDALPSRLYVNSETGEVLWRPQQSDVGAQAFDLVAAGPGGVTSQRVEVNVTCPPLTVGCGCGAAGVEWVALLALAALRSRKSPRA